MCSLDMICWIIFICLLIIMHLTIYIKDSYFLISNEIFFRSCIMSENNVCKCYINEKTYLIFKNESILNLSSKKLEKIPESEYTNTCWNCDMQNNNPYFGCMIMFYYYRIFIDGFVCIFENFVIGELIPNFSDNFSDNFNISDRFDEVGI